jgi:hypothetical protein
MYTTYINASISTPSCTHISLYTVWRVHPPRIAVISYYVFGVPTHFYF